MAIVIGSTRHVVRSLNNNAVRGDQLHQNVRNLDTSEPVGPLQYPNDLNGNLATDEAWTLRCQPLQQRPSSTCLLGIVDHEIAHEDVCVDGYHASVAPSTIARSMSSRVTACPSCRNTPNSRAMGRTGMILTAPSWMMYLTRSPACTDSASRTALGNVVCPFEVIPDSIMRIGLLHYNRTICLAMESIAMDLAVFQVFLLFSVLIAVQPDE